MVFTRHFFGPERCCPVNVGAEVRHLFRLLPTPWLQQQRRWVVHDEGA